MKFLSLATVDFFAIVLATTSNTAVAATVSNNKLPSFSSSNYLPSYRSRFLDDEEDNRNDDDDDDTFDEVSVVLGSCLFFTDDQHHHNTSHSNNSVSSCTDFYGDDVWNYDLMEEYCGLKSNSTLIVEKECPSKESLSWEVDLLTAGWCHVEVITEGNITMIETTPMMTTTTTTTTPTVSNCSNNQKECESVIGWIFKTTSECTTTSMYSSNNISTTTIGDNNNNKNEESDPQVQEVTAEYESCDESKCVSSGLYNLFNYSFTCYTDDNYPSTIYPMMCADGYQPQILENEPIKYDDYNHPFHYFTCCPPTNRTFDSNTSRHCSDPTTFSDLNNTIDSCEGTKQQHPRKMKKHLFFDSYVCCDIDIKDNQPTDFLDKIECVPYQNERYNMPIFHNRYGKIYVNPQCDNPEIGFEYFNIDGDCCKTETRTYHFVQDTLFYWTLYPQIILSSIAVIVCTILIIALIIPLWLHWRVKSAATNVSCSVNRATNRRLQEAAAASTYSSYNLYLVFLAIPDFFLNLYLLGMFGSYANQKFIPKFNSAIIYTSMDGDELNDYGNTHGNMYEAAIILACSTANLYLNCVISYEMILLLRNNNQLIKHNPPSLLKVTLQALGVYLIAITVGIAYFYIAKVAINKGEWFQYLLLGLSLIVTYVFPIGFFFYIWITVMCRGYLPSITKKTKQLVWFFFRIVFVFCLIWLPGMGCVVYGCFEGQHDDSGKILQVGLLFCGIQPVVSTCMAMTKDDVKKYVIELTALSFICTKPSQEA